MEVGRTMGGGLGPAPGGSALSVLSSAEAMLNGKVMLGGMLGRARSGAVEDARAKVSHPPRRKTEALEVMWKGVDDVLSQHHPDPPRRSGGGGASKPPKKTCAWKSCTRALKTILATTPPLIKTSGSTSARHLEKSGGSVSSSGDKNAASSKQRQTSFLRVMPLEVLASWSTSGTRGHQHRRGLPAIYLGGQQEQRSSGLFGGLLGGDHCFEGEVAADYAEFGPPALQRGGSLFL